MSYSWRGAPGRTRALACLLVLAAALLCTGATAGSAFALGTEGSSLQQLAEQETETTPTTTTSSTTSSTSSTSNSKRTILIAMAAAVILLSGIAFVIVRDARRVAPAPDLELAEARTSRDSAVLMRKRRAKAKAARQQRKRTRSR